MKTVPPLPQQPPTTKSTEATETQSLRQNRKNNTRGALWVKSVSISYSALFHTVANPSGPAIREAIV